MFRCIVIILLIALSTSCRSSGGADAAPGATQTPVPPAESDFVQEEGFELSWAVEGEEVLVTMSAPTTGWIAVGFHSEGAMKNAQIAIGWVEGETVSLRDDFGTGFTTHASDASLDGTDDLTVVSGSEEGGRTTISFRMPLAGGGSSDRVLVPGEPCHTVMAYGNDEDDTFTGYHAWAGSIDIEI